MLNVLAKETHRQNRKWWYDKDGNFIERNKGEMIALMHSELSEMLEGVRKNKMDDHLPQHKSEHVELIDLLIRAFDYAGAHKIDLDTIWEDKSDYNASRIDHTYEARAKADGKKF